MKTLWSDIALFLVSIFILCEKFPGSLPWEGNLTACTPQPITFKYTRNFSCPVAAAVINSGCSAVRRQFIERYYPLP